MKIEKEYKKLINFFKLIVWLSIGSITIVGSLSLIFTYNSLSDLKKENQDAIRSLDQKITESWTAYQTSLANYNSFAENSLNRTQDLAREHMRNVEQEAARLAINTAKDRVEEAFRDPKIKELIEESGKELIDTFISERLKSMVRDANDVIDRQIRLVPDLILSTDLIRNGSKSAWNDLVKTNVSTNDSVIFDLTLMIIKSKKQQYADLAKNLCSYKFEKRRPTEIARDLILVRTYGCNDSIVNAKDTTAMQLFLIEYINYPYGDFDDDRLTPFIYSCLFLEDFKTDEKKIVGALMKHIIDREDLNTISIAFELLKYYDYYFEMFDFNSVLDTYDKIIKENDKE